MFLTLEVPEVLTLSKVYYADGFRKKLLGYMFRKHPHYEAILFEGCNSIHSFFMKFPIDVLFLDDHNQVIKKVVALGRGRVILPVKGATYVLESQAGLLAQVQVGQILKKALC